MGLFSMSDPTREWSEVSGPAPDVNSVMQFDKLRFGDPIDSARFLGRPDRFESHNRKECTLFWGAKGLGLRFFEGKLDEVTFLIGAARPTAPDGTILTRDMDRDRIAALFGEPDPDGSDETTLQIFHGHGVASDFRLDDRGRLQEWVLYPE